MEIEGEDGSRIEIRPGSGVVCGRGSGFRTSDPTVSRRHLLLNARDGHGRVLFEVLGRNPVWVRSGGGGGEVRVYRNSDKGELIAGDWVCVSGKQPVWFAAKGIDGGGRGSGSETDGEAEAEGACVPPDTDIDPVKEFGFLVVNHEFDHYPKQMLRKVKDWNWFLEEPKRDSDDEDEEPKKRKRRKKVRGHNVDEEEDEDWTGESEEETEVLTRPAKTPKKPTYSTRSRDRKVPANRTRGGDEKSSQERASGSRGEDDEAEDEEDEEDETLGGFIVDDDDDAQQEEEDNMEDEEDEEEEEEEFIEDDEED